MKPGDANDGGKPLSNKSGSKLPHSTGSRHFGVRELAAAFAHARWTDVTSDASNRTAKHSSEKKLLWNSLRLVGA
jgi:hypothetical protein